MPVVTVVVVSLAVALILAWVIFARWKKQNIASSMGLRQPQETVQIGNEPFAMIRNEAYTGITPAARNMAYVETNLEGGNATNDGNHAVYEELHA